MAIQINDLPFHLLERCGNIEQDPTWHPEGNVLNHSLQVFRWAARESHDLDLVLAALFHDVGKFERSHGHEIVGAEMMLPYLNGKSLWLIEHHRRIWYYLQGDMKKLGKALELARDPWLPDLVQLARWDKMGRNQNKYILFNKQEILERLAKIQEEEYPIDRCSCPEDLGQCVHCQEMKYNL